VLGGAGWTWKVHVANLGTGGPATFASGQVILRDDLPDAALAYGAPALSGVTGIGGTGQVSCAIASSSLQCLAAGGTVTLPPNAAFDVSFTATPSDGGTFANPRAGGTCAVDPGNVIVESAAVDRTCHDTVHVAAADLSVMASDSVGHATTAGTPWTWALHVANDGDAQATFPAGATILTDELPDAGVAYGAPVVSGQTGLTGAGSVSCQIDTAVLTCTASGGPVTLAGSTGAFDVSFIATPSALGTFANPRAGGSCTVDPDDAVPETTAANHACSDTVTVSSVVTTAPPPPPPAPPTPTSPPPPPPPAKPNPPQLPDNHFEVSKLKADRHGVVTLSTTVPGAGVVTVTITARKAHGKGLLRFSHLARTAVHAGTLHLKLKPTASARRLLRAARRSTAISVTVTYTPTGGAPAKHHFSRRVAHH
jgi:hypothetical protein